MKTVFVLFAVLIAVTTAHAQTNKPRTPKTDVVSTSYCSSWGSQRGRFKNELILNATVPPGDTNKANRTLSFQIKNAQDAEPSFRPHVVGPDGVETEVASQPAEEAKSSEATVVVDIADLQAVNRDFLAARHLLRTWQNEGAKSKRSQADFVPVPGLKLTLVRKANTAACFASMSVTQKDAVCTYEIGDPESFSKFLDSFQTAKANLEK